MTSQESVSENSVAAPETTGEIMADAASESPRSIDAVRRNRLLRRAAMLAIALLLAGLSGFLGSRLHHRMSGDDARITSANTAVTQLADRVATLEGEISGVVSDGVTQDQLRSALAQRDTEVATALTEMRAVIAELDDRVMIAVSEARADPRPGIDDASGTDLAVDGMADQVAEPITSDAPTTDRQASSVAEVPSAPTAVPDTAQQVVSSEWIDVGQEAVQLMAIASARVAAELGIPYAAILDRSGFAETDLPPVIWQAAQSGLATMARLDADFDHAAEAALAASATNGLLGSIIQVRPLNPRMGSDPAAVISRAQEALDAARIDEALDILGGLEPEIASHFGDWSRAVHMRSQTLAAFDAILADGLRR